MGIILWIIFGALAGWIASIIMGTNAEQGAMANILVGIVGSLIGGLIANLLGFGSYSGFNLGSIFLAVLGSVILLAILKAVRPNRTI